MRAAAAAEQGRRGRRAQASELGQRAAPSAERQNVNSRRRGARYDGGIQFSDREANFRRGFRALLAEAEQRLSSLFSFFFYYQNRELL
jgi:hypothetical protein